MIITTISTSNKLNSPRNPLASDVMQKVWPFFITFLQKKKRRQDIPFREKHLFVLEQVINSKQLSRPLFIKR